MLICAVVFAVSFRAYTPSDRESAAGTPPSHTAFEANLECHQFVKDRLKAPSSAKFSDFSDSLVMGTSDGPYVVRSSLESQNALGVMLKTRYMCTVTFQGKDAHLSSLDFDN